MCSKYMDLGVFIASDVYLFVDFQVRRRGRWRHQGPLPVPALFQQRRARRRERHGRVVPRPDVGVAADVRERGDQRAERALAGAAVRGQDGGVWGGDH